MEEKKKIVNIYTTDSGVRTCELVEALRRGRPGTEFNLIDALGSGCRAPADWFMMMEPDSVGVSSALTWMKKGVPVISVESEVADALLNDDCALIFGPEPTDEEFVRGMLPFLESETRMAAMRAGARCAAESMDNVIAEGAEPVVSVIVMCRNQERTVRAAIESVLGQICSFPVEIIIGEDDSADSTREICEEYVRLYPGRVRLMPAAPNKGIARNYFDCLGACRGRYVADCSGDDRWVDPFRLQMQVDYLESHSDDVSVMSDWLIAENGTIIRSSDIKACPGFSNGFSGEDMIQFIMGFGRYFPFLSAMIYRREVIAGLMDADPTALCRSEWGCEDVPLLFHLARAGSIGYLPLTAALYNVHAGGVSSGAGDDGYRFIHGLTLCISELCAMYEVGISADAAAGMNRRLTYLASIISVNPTDDRISDFEKLCRRWPLPLSFKNRIYRIAFRSSTGMNLLRLFKSLTKS